MKKFMYSSIIVSAFEYIYIYIYRNIYLLYPEVFCSHPCVIQVQKHLVGFHGRSHKLEEDIQASTFYLITKSLSMLKLP